MTSTITFSLTGVVLFSMGISAVFLCPQFLRKILAVNMAGSGLFLVLVSLAKRQADAPPDPVPHALVLTGIVVAVSATALALALYRNLVATAVEGESLEDPDGSR